MGRASGRGIGLDRGGHILLHVVRQWVRALGTLALGLELCLRCIELGLLLLLLSLSPHQLMCLLCYLLLSLKKGLLLLLLSPQHGRLGFFRQLCPGELTVMWLILSLGWG